jgi:hypothetical protein
MTLSALRCRRHIDQRSPHQIVAVTGDEAPIVRFDDRRRGVVEFGDESDRQTAATSWRCSNDGNE